MINRCHCFLYMNCIRYSSCSAFYVFVVLVEILIQTLTLEREMTEFLYIQTCMCAPMGSGGNNDDDDDIGVFLKSPGAWNNKWSHPLLQIATWRKMIWEPTLKCNHFINENISIVRVCSCDWGLFSVWRQKNKSSKRKLKKKICYSI